MKKTVYLYKYIIALIVAITVVIAIISISKNINNNDSTQLKETMATSVLEYSVPITKQNSSKDIDIDSIIAKNEEEIVTEVIEKEETDIEFTTIYRQNDSLSKGKIQTLQEGQDGKQDAIIKKIYKTSF